MTDRRERTERFEKSTYGLAARLRDSLEDAGCMRVKAGAVFHAVHCFADALLAELDEGEPYPILPHDEAADAELGRITTRMQAEKRDRHISQWPAPRSIQDDPPTEADGDERGEVLVWNPGWGFGIRGVHGSGKEIGRDETKWWPLPPTNEGTE